MSNAAFKESRPLSILHVLTLNGRNGEYGGPVRVAREISKELTNRGHIVEIFSGAQRGSGPIPINSSIESFVLVRPLIKALPLSSLWSFRVIPALWKRIKRSEIIHIHFARDLIPFTTAVIALIKGKPYVAQTHGMIISDGRLSTKVIDLLLTRPLLNRSEMVMVLTEIELKKLQELKVTSKFAILPNGIYVNLKKPPPEVIGAKIIVFCSRLHSRKGVDKFVDLAELVGERGIKFKIYGPDSGSLSETLARIQEKKLSGYVSYEGALAPNQVPGVLSNSDLLVLPSKDEPFPMVVLEALSVGTPVLVMPSCGFANILSSFNPNFVSPTEDVKGLYQAFNKIADFDRRMPRSVEIMEMCEQYFGIRSIGDSLIRSYSLILEQRLL